MFDCARSSNMTFRYSEMIRATWNEIWTRRKSLYKMLRLLNKDPILTHILTHCCRFASTLFVAVNLICR